ncbi:hypothetical protein SLEP1_g53665 [Rubroshorea leprosula]|uniref:Wall-associated receptor kinase galacturonan-binding domain-containing protein n=1 Tax=Rubroshorea leprosula TaxID=152421 RepID=A0AAV5MCF5_9ROSI|nr:hypothetical protein SLEP1_g53665 [Rubroshorea leprosula]
MLGESTIPILLKFKFSQSSGVLCRNLKASLCSHPISLDLDDMDSSFRILVRAKVVALFALMALAVSLFPDTYIADCVPSSCGNLTIDYPFRLRSDPKECGYPELELVCENNRTTLPLKRSTYQNFLVEEIFYDNDTVRVVDASLDRNKCSIPYYPFLKFQCWPFQNGPSFGNITENSIIIEAQFPVMLSNISGLSASDIYLQMLMGFELKYWPWFPYNNVEYCSSSLSLLKKIKEDHERKKQA